MEPFHETQADEERFAQELRAAFGLAAGSTGFEVNLNPGRSIGSSGGQAGFEGAAGLVTGARLGDFEILGEIGRGGMGIVYRARQVALNREVALKVLPDFAHRGRLAIQRFRNEAQAAARLHHTNIVPIYAQGEDRGRFYYAMELIEGASLDAAIRCRSRILSPSNPTLAPVPVRGSQDETVYLPPSTTRMGRSAGPGAAGDRTAEVDGARDLLALRRTQRDFAHLARLIAEVADALDHAHAGGVIHRDIKPQNLLVGPDNRLHVTDFGLARLADGPAITMPGEVMGTPAYLSPEQVSADQQAIDHRTDIYSLGVTLYELLTLHRPFEGETREQILTGIRTLEPAAPRTFDRHIPRDLQTICLKAMEKDLSKRYPAASAMADDLRRFAEGRPILSKPPGPLTRAGKWARRHRATTTAMVAATLVVMLAAGLVTTRASMRRAEADRLVGNAYDRLVYLDYRGAPETLNDLRRAAELGGDSAEITRLTCLVDLFDAHDEGGGERAIEALSALADREPENPETLYLLACAHDRHGRNQGDAGGEIHARELIERADRLGSNSPAAWFYRGLALHWRDPDEALASYDRARVLRAAQGDVFLQATLQVARARNQRMYATRSIGDFGAAADALKQLIDYGVYGSYPYYLLSTAHRLAAEIYQGSVGTRDGDAEVAKHYQAALDAARAGEAVEPGNPSPVSAEALCLESMGDDAGAIDAHTRSIALASDENGDQTDYRERFCEAHHYRWRLYFWAGAHDAALDDLAVHQQCMPDDRIFYPHVYPALVLADRGDLDRAVAEAYAITDESPASPLNVIWTATCLRLLGREAEAAQHLDTCADHVDFSLGATAERTAAWQKALFDLVRGTSTQDDLAGLIEQSNRPWRLRGEAEFHAAAMALAAGDREAAVSGFSRSRRSFDSEVRYAFHAQVILGKLERDTRWPRWISWLGVDLHDPNNVKPNVGQ